MPIALEQPISGDTILTPEEAADELLRRRAARRRMLGFTTYTWEGFGVNWHHEIICDYLDRFATSEIQNLMVFAPAQHSKSELCSRRLPAFMLGRNPDLKILAASYAAELIQGMNRDVQRIMDSAEYKRLFPETRLGSANIRTISGSWLRNNDVFEIVGRRGSYRCAGVSGGLSGFACDIGILDDPYKDMQQASSPTVRLAVWEWYTSVFLRRLHKRSRQLFVLTRWHEDDLAGRLLDMQGTVEEGGRWTVLKLQGIKEAPDPKDKVKPPPEDPRKEGEALWPERFDAAQLLMQKQLNRSHFEAMTQQNPRSKGGAMFKRVYFEGKRVPAAPLKATRVRRWDFAGSEDKGDYTHGTLMAQTNEGYFIEDIVRGQWEGEERNKIIRETAAKDKARYGLGVKIIVPQDVGSAGKDVAKAAKKMLAGYSVDSERETGSKEVRAKPFADQCSVGNVFFVDNDEPVENFFHKGQPITTREEVIELTIEEYCAFPKGSNDDAVDTGAGAFNELALHGTWVHDKNMIEWLKKRAGGEAPEPAPDTRTEDEKQVEYVNDWMRDALAAKARDRAQASSAGMSPAVSSVAPTAVVTSSEESLHGHSAKAVSPPGGSTVALSVPTSLSVPELVVPDRRR